MSTFAEELIEQIKQSPIFLKDLGALYSYAFKYDLGVETDITLLSQKESKRLIEAAFILSQSQKDENINLAQNISYFLNTITDDNFLKKLTIDIFNQTGNFPSAKTLALKSNFISSPIEDFRNSILCSLNRVTIDNNTFILTEFQKNIWDTLEQPVNQAISGPTSAGKTFLVLEYLIKKILDEKSYTIIYIAPTRALVHEVSSKLSNKIKRYKHEIRVSTIPTINLDLAKQIFVLTQERLQVLLNIYDASKINLVVVDEAQAIGDEIRGMILQDCLEQIKQSSVNVKFLFLAPGADGFENLKSAIGLENIFIEKTETSPVIQNKIIVKMLSSDQNSLSLSLLEKSNRIFLGNIKTNRGFANTKTRLAAIALELGKNSNSLIYGTGASNAESTARQIASDRPTIANEYLIELSKFIKKHIHPEYSLAEFVLKGVAYHYGNMPSLLREALERGFSENHIQFLVCTTTLFQGINLPAKNVFINTPTRGNKGEKLDEAALWNFAGRAGRLGYEVSGNVYLIDYDEWDTQPLNSKVNFKILPSFKKTIKNNFISVIEYIDGTNQKSPNGPSIEAAAGLIISRSAKGTLDSFVNRSLSQEIPQDDLDKLISTTKVSLTKINLPHKALKSNWTVNIYGQARLYNRFIELINIGDIDSLIPRNPTQNVYRNYVLIFSRINKYILQNNNSKFSNYLTNMALSWMNGKPLPFLIAREIKYKQVSSKSVNIDSIIRGVFDFVETNLRFKYVQLGRAYIELLELAFLETGNSEKIKEIYDFPLALELGVSTNAGQAFIELGLSRITAATLEGMIPNSNPKIEEVREWLNGLQENSFDLSYLIVRELKDKNLINFAPN